MCMYHYILLYITHARVDAVSGDEEALLETAVILTEEDVEALKEFFLTPTDVIDFLKHL